MQKLIEDLQYSDLTLRTRSRQVLANEAYERGIQRKWKIVN